MLPERVDMFGPGGQAQLDEMRLGGCYRLRIDSLRDLIRALDEEIGPPSRSPPPYGADPAGRQSSGGSAT